MRRIFGLIGGVRRTVGREGGLTPSIERLNLCPLASGCRFWRMNWNNCLPLNVTLAGNCTTGVSTWGWFVKTLEPLPFNFTAQMCSRFINHLNPISKSVHNYQVQRLASTTYRYKTKVSTTTLLRPICFPFICQNPLFLQKQCSSAMNKDLRL